MQGQCQLDLMRWAYEIENRRPRRTTVNKLEARAGIEPAVELLQSSALPLGDRAV